MKHIFFLLIFFLKSFEKVNQKIIYQKFFKYGFLKIHWHSWKSIHNKYNNAVFLFSEQLNNSFQKTIIFKYIYLPRMGWLASSSWSHQGIFHPFLEYELGNLNWNIDLIFFSARCYLQNFSFSITQPLVFNIFYT